MPQHIVKTGVRCAGRCGHRPLQTVCEFASACSISLVQPAGRTEASAPTKDFTFLPKIVQFCGCVLRGRGRTPPLRNRGRFCGFALSRSNLQHCTAQSFRHGFAVPPPFTQGRLWCGANVAARCNPAAGGRGKPRPYVTTKRAAAQNVQPFPSSVAYGDSYPYPLCPSGISP